LIQAHAFTEPVDSPFDAHRFIDVLLDLVVRGLGNNPDSTIAGKQS
jgi:hypothetical protein